ncbi:MAG: right-handed parallel beta-helix repeat-containing protein, partial [Verrucomicrobia bacterium]|nr:right-handed parallel beta-helix repeat-containing protein [Verrucomicrobiota bacterium]
MTNGHLRAMAAACAVWAGAAHGAEFHVATGGSDAWSGTLAAPDKVKSNGPFATIERTRDAARALRASNAAPGPVTIR